jgi:hypothetical protein
MGLAFEGLRDHDPTEAAGGLAVPGLYVAAGELQPRSDMARFHEMFPQILFGKTVGSEHFCQLQMPEQVNAMIECFLAITLLANTRSGHRVAIPVSAGTQRW